MTSVNPNSRAQFTGSDGRLTKYGMDIIADIYRILGIVGGASKLDDITTQLGEMSVLPGLLANNIALAERIADLEKSAADASVLMARISALESRIADLERDSQPVLPISSIFQRLDAIEAQL